MYYISQPLYVTMSESYNHCLAIFEAWEINVFFTTDGLFFILFFWQGDIFLSTKANNYR